MSLEPDMFDYSGPEDLTEYTVRVTEITRDRAAIRVKVKQGNLPRCKEILLSSLDHLAKAAAQLGSHYIPAHSSDKYHRPHGQLLQQTFLRRQSPLFTRDPDLFDTKIIISQILNSALYKV